ncbi:Vesicle transport protein SFT2B [Glycine max]|nr:Vesicle transport protein SFT2B [Glycine max]
MEKMNKAFEKVKIMVGMDVEDEEQQAAALDNSNSFAFMDDFNRNCTLSTTQLVLDEALDQQPEIDREGAFKVWMVDLVEQPDIFDTPIKRLYGFAICFASGLTCTLLSMLVFFKPIKFAIAFTLGNLLSLGSTAFLIGPKRQVTMMLDPARIYATAIYIASMIIALFCALYVHNKLLTLLAIILEFGALVWYSLSYIPFARAMVSKIMVSCFDTEF